MSKTSGTVWKCQECGAEYVRKPMGKCSKCGAFQKFAEVSAVSGSGTDVARAGLKSSGAVRPTKKAMSVRDVERNPIHRTPTGIGELDRVLGGGFVDSEVILFAGQPGSGKSTLSLSVSDRFAQMGKKVLYSSGEESEQQIGLRAQRMNVSNDNILIINETNLETLLGHIESEKPDVLVVDSLQTLASLSIPGSIGSVQQSKEAAHTLTRLAKSSGIIMILINQIVKSGEFSGSESIQHIVDATLMLESDSESPLKFLRATKNRFGDTTEVGVFQHSEQGLEEVSDPSGILFDRKLDEDVSLSGTAMSFISEGVRQIPVEIQSLVAASNLATPRKQFNGVAYNRGQIVCAILDKFCKTKLYERDVFVNTVSGMKVDDPLCDLAVAASLLSSSKEKPVPDRMAFVGELSLTGQVRGSFLIAAKIREAARLGFDTVIVPKGTKVPSELHSIAIRQVSFVSELAGILGQ